MPGALIDEGGERKSAARSGEPSGAVIRIAVDDTHEVSGLLQIPHGAAACLVLAHGAGAGMTHPFMAAIADGLFARGVATLRYQFPFIEQGSKRPDRPALAQATVRAAAAMAAELAPALPLFAGGKSFGGRMTSHAQAEASIPGVRGLIFFGFPLHPARQPSVARAEHLARIVVPSLFLQGTRDALADVDLMTDVIARLWPLATLLPIADADHAFHVPARTARRDPDVLSAMLDAVADWIGRLRERA